MPSTNGADGLAIRTGCARTCYACTPSRTRLSLARRSALIQRMAIWKLADELESEFLDIADGAKHAISRLEPLTRLAPDE